MKSIRVVAAIIVNDKQEVLCALRSQSMSLPGLWEFPGGKIEVEETPQEALIREITEELGCNIEVADLVTEVTHEYPNIIVNLSTYYARIIHGKPIAKEHEKLAWMPLKQLRSLAWAPADVPTVEILTRGLSE
ncbi:(deoxy)nucleoside triphosphate pyrophosphohydrolase [Alicyclobacillus cycloheptanicus]|uniref:8-oxo-dGTP diphosphatase n=1 Tax=Alicyclobacillus cycloheptanicus TaxID=1457 RepID=A0ABT9XPD6_9BACL|nr:(deoxy)nucleoside triphosphate pyrophosphohydrolase [Alicyclobacillus cycloheptanicus]MDQ0191566.1 8-oxo-dGTP diphosphatase [Alicyclobacillus cycloheptanicus]WDM02432.1 (deoxy)nucleoside triphosphate pyrophosphohydrolase [Alicyclobacillus cycloheptanicus]